MPGGRTASEWQRTTIQTRWQQKEALMEEILRSLAVQPEPWSAGGILLNTILAYLLGLFIAWIYQTTNRTLTTSYSFVNTLVLLAMIMGLVIMVIGNNIARAFGLAGAMSIIRFRTVVKDTRDTTFVFFSLGAGMAAGTGNIRIALLGTLLIGLLIAILHWTRHGAVERDEYLLSFAVLPDDYAGEPKNYQPSFARYLKHQNLVSVKSERMGESLRLAFHVTLKNPSEADRLVAELSNLEGVQRVTLLYGDDGQT
jgi:uncharacterized membrane protein YhiD involved in acid resistance